MGDLIAMVKDAVIAAGRIYGSNGNAGCGYCNV